MTEQRESSAGGPFLRTAGGVLRFLVRLILVLIIGGLIGLGIYLGVPWAYRSLVWPVQDNRARVAILEQRMDNRLFRPRALYGGHEPRAFVPIELRD